MVSPIYLDLDTTPVGEFPNQFLRRLNGVEEKPKPSIPTIPVDAVITPLSDAEQVVLEFGVESTGPYGLLDYLKHVNFKLINSDSTNLTSKAEEPYDDITILDPESKTILERNPNLVKDFKNAVKAHFASVVDLEGNPDLKEEWLSESEDMDFILRTARILTTTVPSAKAVLVVGDESLILDILSKVVIAGSPQPRLLVFVDTNKPNIYCSVGLVRVGDSTITMLFDDEFADCYSVVETKRDENGNIISNRVTFELNEQGTKFTNIYPHIPF